MKQTHRPPRSIYPAQNRHMRRRTRVLAGLVAVLCFGGLLARLFTLQILDPSGYANRAAAQQLRDTTLPAARGEIYSADGVTLAASKTCWTIRASPRELADELVQPAAKALSEILNIDYDATLQKLSKRTSNDCLLRRRVEGVDPALAAAATTQALVVWPPISCRSPPSATNTPSSIVPTSSGIARRSPYVARAVIRSVPSWARSAATVATLPPVRTTRRISCKAASAATARCGSTS